MARVDTIVLGAGIVGTSIAVHLAKRGVAVALVDRGGPGEGTSYGNSGIIEGNTLFPPAFPSSFSALLRVALKRAPEANYHLSFLPQVAPWLLRCRPSLKAILGVVRLQVVLTRLRSDRIIVRMINGAAIKPMSAIATSSGNAP